MTTVTIKVDFELDNEFFEDLLDTAGYGINHWADAASIELKDEDGDEVFYRVKEEDGDEFVITKDDMQATIRDIVSSSKFWWVNKNLKSSLSLLCLGDDDVDLDAADADVLVQIACFRELRYA